jgi:hypothetical protein
MAFLSATIGYSVFGLETDAASLEGRPSSVCGLLTLSGGAPYVVV